MIWLGRRPGFDDSKWQTIAAGQDWESQGHWDYTGFAWYRRELVLDAPVTKAADWDLGLYLPAIDSAAEVYWNGVMVGSFGKVPPNPVWFGFFAACSVDGGSWTGDEWGAGDSGLEGAVYLPEL